MTFTTQLTVDAMASQTWTTKAAWDLSRRLMIPRLWSLQRVGHVKAVRPKFKNPPLIERAISVAFEPLQDFSLGDFGLFWSRIKDEFPVSESMPLVRQEIEDLTGFPAAKNRIEIVPPETLPRAFFRNPELGELVQVQQDRFSFNWIKRNDEDRYPHSEQVFAKFGTLLESFEEFLANRKIGQVAPLQCELTNVNVIPLADVGDAFPDMATLVRMADLSNDFECIELESQMSGSKFFILGENGAPIGRVHCAAQPTQKVGSDELALRIDITARGAPLSKDRVGIEKFLTAAGSAVNAVFLANITRAGRQFWGEQDG